MCCGVVRLSSHRRPKGQLQPHVDLETFRAYCAQRRGAVAWKLGFSKKKDAH